MNQKKRFVELTALCSLFFAHSGCSDPWITVHLEGNWPERIHVSVKYVDGAQEAGTPFDIAPKDGRFSFHIPRDSGRINLTITSLMDKNNEQNCRMQHYAGELDAAESKYGKNVTIPFSIIPLLPLRCGCDAGWCQAKDGFLLSKSWKAVIGTEPKIWIVGDSNSSAYWDGISWSSGRVNADLAATSNQYTLWLHQSTPLAAGVSTIARWTGTAWVSPSEYDFSQEPKLAGQSLIWQSIWGDQKDSIWFVGQTNNGYIVSRQGVNTVPEQIDLGGAIKNWNVLSSIWGAGSSEIWSVGEQGVILVRKNSKWQDATDRKSDSIKGVTSGLNSIWGTDFQNIWIVGDNRTIWHWTGSQWAAEGVDEKAVPITTKFYSVWGASERDVWAVGSAGTIVHYDGQTWKKMASTSASGGNDLRAIWGSDRDNIWIVGDGGTVLIRDP